MLHLRAAGSCPHTARIGNTFWKAEGGMVPSGVQWNLVDLVENNIRFRVTSPDGKSFENATEWRKLKIINRNEVN